MSDVNVAEDGFDDMSEVLNIYLNQYNRIMEEWILRMMNIIKIKVAMVPRVSFELN